MKSRSRCTLKSGLPLWRNPAGKRAATVNTNGVELPTSSAPWNRWPDATSPYRSGLEFAMVVAKLALAYPEASTIHLVMDNLNIHRRKSLTDTFGNEIGTEIWDRFRVHYTPKHGSWLNQAEIEIGLFSRQCLGKRRIPDLKILTRETRAWNRRVNAAHTCIHWKFGRRDARRKFHYNNNTFKRSQY
jgi:hypothetical protein